MKIGHIAMWTTQLEALKAFYITYFGATAGEKYVNAQRGFSSYFLSFQGEVTLELMQVSSVIPRPYARTAQPVGLTHIAFDVGSKDAVDRLAERLQADGYTLEKAPRITGDGFYECAVFDPDDNIVEITYNP
jgi:lactoylglutathione lyase